MENPISPKTGFFASRCKALRNEAGLSQADLSDRSGVAISTVRQFEYGRREPTYETLVKLARGLGVSLAAFDQDQPAPPKKRRKPKRPAE